MSSLEKNCYRYVVVGLGKSLPNLGGGNDCTEPPCTPAYPGISVSGVWEKGFVQIQPTDATKQFSPRAISAVDFASEELARFWLDQTTNGQDFRNWYDQIILVRVYNG